MRRSLSLLLTLLVTGCAAPEELPSITPSPERTLTITGHMTSGQAAGRRVVLCEVASTGCVLTSHTTTSSIDGYFTFESAPNTSYWLLYESGNGNFESAVTRLEGQTLQPGNWLWISDQLLSGIIPILPLSTDVTIALDTFLFSESPFVLAHQMINDNVVPVTAQSDNTTVSFPVLLPALPAYESIRQEMGSLSREEVLVLDRELVEQWVKFINGDDTAYHDGIHRVILGLRDGSIKLIGNTFLTAVDVWDGQLVKQAGYGIIDTQTGDRIIVGLFDESSRDVLEVRTGYRLNVRDHPGQWLEQGPDGELFYHYGFSYDRRWNQILADPVIDVIDVFYSSGVAHVSNFMDSYQASAEQIRGDMNLVTWDASVLDQMRDFKPPDSAAPYVKLPDSGTVDVNRDRFLQAVSNEAVMVDRQRLNAYLNSRTATSSNYVQYPTDQEVIDALLTPYRSGHLFSDMEAAIILAATYDGQEGPLTITISSRLEQGFSVPRRRDKDISISQNEVANVILGYPGTLNARWAHEMSHMLDFRDPTYQTLFNRGGYSRCEPLKYMMEFVWWVQRYPYDAPDEDWMPISSGLTLARLLTWTYPNSGC